MAGGHIGEDKTLRKLRERCYWPGHQKDVRSGAEHAKTVLQ